MTEGLVRLGVRVIAIDQSEAMLEVLRTKFPANGAVEVRRGYADDIPIADDAVEYAFANMYLHHVEEPAHAIREMVRILKPGGKLVITDLDEHNFEFLRAQHHDRWMGFRRQDVQDWLRSAGMVRVAGESTGETCTSRAEREASGANIGIFIASGEK